MLTLNCLHVLQDRVLQIELYFLYLLNYGNIGDKRHTKLIIGLRNNDSKSHCRAVRLSDTVHRSLEILTLVYIVYPI